MQHIDEQYILDNFETALENGYIKAYYQPVIRTLTEKICSVEALARWQDPSTGLLSPYIFISVLEKNRLIHKLDLSILENICVTYNEMREKGLPLHPFSINLSRLDFNEVNMLDEISKIINRYDIPADAIHIEITESVMLDNTAYFRRIFDSFHDAGFAILMDDFGSGYSSLNVLKDYRFDVLKIDMRFLSDIGSRSKKILISVVNMAKAIGIHTLAEGVETQEQLNFLRGIGCEMLQGYYYARPMSSEDYIKYLSEDTITIEPTQDNEYWDTIGQVNFLSPDPLSDLSFDDNDVSESTIVRESATPLALIEVSPDNAKLVYSNQAYFNELKKLGYTSTDHFQQAIDNMQPVYYGNMLEQVAASIKTGELIKKDYFANDIYYTYYTKCIAKGRNGKAMLAVSMQTFEPTDDVNRSETFEKYSRIIIDFYDHLSIISYETNKVMTRIYSKMAFPKDYLTMPLNEAIEKFAENEVLETERFKDVFSSEYIDKHIAETGKIAFQKPFHIKGPNGEYILKDVRLFYIQIDNAKSFVFAIEPMAHEADVIARKVLKDYPELII